MKTIDRECYVSLEVAKLLKEVGFDWEVQSYYSKLSRKQGKLLWLTCGCKYKENININQNRYSAPTLDVAQRWLREVKGKEVEIEVFPDELVGTTWGFHLYDLGACDSIVFQNPYTYSTFEEAQEAGIKKALEIILEKGKKK